MIDSTSVLFGLADEFDVTRLERLSSSDLRVVIEHREREAARPGCGTLTARVKNRPLVRVRDLDACGQVIQLGWRKRRLACFEPLGATGSFTQPSAAIPARAADHEVAEAIATAVAGGNRAVEEVARAHGVSWPTAHRARVAAAARWLPAPEPVRVLRVDEARARSVRWVLADVGWRRSDPWLTSFVAADTTARGGCSAWRPAAPAPASRTGSPSRPPRSGRGAGRGHRHLRPVRLRDPRRASRGAGRGREVACSSSRILRLASFSSAFSGAVVPGRTPSSTSA